MAFGVGVLVATGSAVDSSVGVLVDSASTARPTAPPCPAGAAGAQASATRHRATIPIAAVRKASLRALRRRDITKSPCGAGTSGGRIARQCTLCGNPCQTAGRAARWLAMQRNAFGSYGSTQDTVASLPALAESAATAGLAADLKVIIYLGNVRPGAPPELRFAARAQYPARARPVTSQAYSYYTPHWRGETLGQDITVSANQAANRPAALAAMLSRPAPPKQPCSAGCSAPAEVRRPPSLKKQEQQKAGAAKSGGSGRRPCAPGLSIPARTSRDAPPATPAAATRPAPRTAPGAPPAAAHRPSSRR